MGSFGCYAGNMNISNDKKEEFNNAMENILNKGGMMSFEHIQLFGKEIHLLKPFRLEGEKKVWFHYNYFEDDSWETAEYDPVDCYLYTGKIGSYEFNQVIMAAYTLYELYDESPGLATNDVDPAIQFAGYVGWINHLLGTKFTTEKYYKLWENMEYNPMYGEFLYRVINGSDKRYLGLDGNEYVECHLIEYGTEDLQTVLEQKEEDTYLYHLAFAREKVHLLLDNDKEENVTELQKILSMSYEERKSYAQNQVNDVLCDIAYESLSIPAKMLTLFMLEQMEGESFSEKNRNDFAIQYWDYWKEHKKEYYSDEMNRFRLNESMTEEKIKTRNKNAPKEFTTTFLRCEQLFDNGWKEYPTLPDYYVSELDCVFWKKEDDFFYKNEKQKLEDYGNQYKKILNFGKIQDYDVTNYIRDFIDLLDKANTTYTRIFCFSDMFYEFVEHCKEKEYIAALKFLENIIAENTEYASLASDELHWWHLSRRAKFNPSRRKVKQIFAILANKDIRKVYFGF